MSRLASVRERLEPLRVFALLGTLGLVASFTSVLYGLVDVAGGTREFGLLVLIALLAATALAGVLRAVHALVLAGLFLAVGLSWYILSLPYVPQLLPVLQSNLELLTGQSVHQIRQSGTWALAVAPAPVFVTWYFALRRWYGTAVVVGGSMLGYVVLTGDATLTITLVGVVGGTAMLGFGDLDRHGGSGAGAEHVAVGLAVMVAIPLAVTVVPGGAGGPLTLVEGGQQTLESSLLGGNSQLNVVGSIELSPDVRFTIQSQEGRYWKASSFDRYTGEGWVRTGGQAPLSDRDLPFPPGTRETIVQRVEVESRLSSLPAAWRPVDVGGEIADRVAVTAQGDITATEPLEPGDTYRVTSAVPASWEDLLASAGEEYPADLHDRYTRLPESTPDRVAARTAEITRNATSPYTTALAIEQWLEANREYSLDVERPDENIADSFLFEMEQGYCTYYATTMVVMLRTQGIPARMVTGYTTGQQVAENRWVVRGLDAHAWVEVYFPDTGWVAFDPTPATPRTIAEQERIQDARSNNNSAVDTNESEGLTQTPPPPGDDEFFDESGATGPAATPSIPINQRIAGGAPDPGLEGGEAIQADGGGTDLPGREQVALGLVLLAGAAAGARRSGLTRWVARTGRMLYQRRTDPETDVEVAFRRASIVLARRHRPRRAGETVRQYLDAIDAPPPARRLATIRERATYGTAVDEAMADEAVELVDDLREYYDGRSRHSQAPNW